MYILYIADSNLVEQFNKLVKRTFGTERPIWKNSGTFPPIPVQRQSMGSCFIS